MRQIVEVATYRIGDFDNMDNAIREDFYAAKDIVFKMGYDEYIEIRSLPVDPMKHHLFTPLASWRVKDANGNYDIIDIFCMALGGVLITNEL